MRYEIVFLMVMLFVASSISTTPQQPSEIFPIPAMQEIWPGAHSNETNRRLLWRAVSADLRGIEKIAPSRKKVSFDDIDAAEIPLGKLGQGVIVLMSHSVLCGTGGCPIYAYVHERAGYKRVLRSFGWAFAVVKSDAAVPDIAVASTGGGGQVGLTLYRYNERAFTRSACEILKAKPRQPGSAAFSWWDPTWVDIEPCGR